MRHYSLPATLSAERLADWIRDNKVDTFNHVEEVPLTEEEIQEFEHESSLASRAIDKLKFLKSLFDETLKKGTPFNVEKMDHEPVSYTIPPTKGIESLSKNREFADKSIEKGFKEEITNLFLIPHPEEGRMVMVDITGVEYEQYSRDMSNDEINQHKPLLKKSVKPTLDL